MRVRCSASAVAILYLTAICVAAEDVKAPKSKEATGVLEAVPIGLDDQPLKRNSVSLWREVAKDAADKDLWHDRSTDTWWKSLQGFATSGSSTFENLEPGKYRVAVREGHDPTGAFGLGEPVTIDTDHQKVQTKIALAAGGELQLVCSDAKSGKPVPPPSFNLELVSDSVWKGRQFAAEPVAGTPGEWVYQKLPEGTYRLRASRRASNPDDVKYSLVGDGIEVGIQSKEVVKRELKFRASRLTEEEIAREWPWVVRGKVTDEKGAPVADAIVRAHSGMGSLFQTGATITDSQGRYTLRFGPGIHIADGGYNTQVALISVSKPGMQEVNLNKQGELMMANKQPEKSGDRPKDRPLVLPNQPMEIDFKMSLVGSLGIRIHRDDRDDLKDLHVSLKGDSMPPGSSVVDSGTTDRWGSVSFAEVPLDKEWWIEIETNSKREVRTQPFRLTAPQRYELSLQWHTDAEGVQTLDITSLHDALYRDQTLTLVGDAR